jgi:hypothetical protein
VRILGAPYIGGGLDSTEYNLRPTGDCIVMLRGDTAGEVGDATGFGFCVVIVGICLFADMI